ncbi:cAMP-dependent protein kinase catalytic subunit alpha-like [Pectinophora gossypiella]|uniref:cAMP-dependent protein kinase catalytic subunit alpha-like n=1 Tax=Pectinophora gossypiella TaxID=13191 RepID=UPI00214EBEC5|nr:cAMP-dependent protein kinase catalytic subunit alpha-like [Pectinophora gossypiella]
MTLESGDDHHNRKKYSHQAQQTHKRLLDSYKFEFYEKYSNEEAFSTRKQVTDYDRIKTVGLGAFAAVFLVRDKDTLQVHAMKAVDKGEVVKKKAVKHLHNEKKILQCVNFPFVMNCDSVCKDNRDIKPENIFIDKNGYVKIGDYGFAKVIKSRTWTLCGTPQYLAPEIIMSKGYSYSVDWWSFGVLIFEMVSGYAPFCHHEPAKLYDKILLGRFKAPDTMSGICKQLVKRLLNVDPTKRYGSLKSGVYDIKSHEWFGDIDWGSIFHQKIEAPHVPIVKDLGVGEGFTERGDVMLKTSPVCEYEEEFRNF